MIWARDEGADSESLRAAVFGNQPETDQEDVQRSDGETE